MTLIMYCVLCMRTRVQRISVDYEALLKEHEDVKKRLEASKARSKYLSTENKTLKSQISDLLVKSKHDDELVDALLVRVQLGLHLELLNENFLFPTTFLFSLKSEHVTCMTAVQNRILWQVDLFFFKQQPFCTR